MIEEILTCECYNCGKDIKILERVYSIWIIDTFFDFCSVECLVAFERVSSK